ncbi:FliI/YscN family ATPase [Gluconobacter wancherniae]|uniref:FliI/YscN family ATPase n=1 Tax=Gluconobacter wancherniae TaxID=1307955 RepID=UPI00201275B2|nr:FliI/YscN family ATPase [Gluconobacter wancherniae]
MTDIPLTPLSHAPDNTASADGIIDTARPTVSLASALEADFVRLHALQRTDEKRQAQEVAPEEMEQTVSPSDPETPDAQAGQSGASLIGQYPASENADLTDAPRLPDETEAGKLQAKQAQVSRDPSQTADHVIARMKTLLPMLRSRAAGIDTHPMQGRVVSATGTIIRAILPNVAVGDLCRLQNHDRDWSLDAEVVGLDGNEVLMTPMGSLEGVSVDTEVVTTGGRRSFPVGERLLGRVLDALGTPIDGLGPLEAGPSRSVQAAPPPAMERQSIARPLPVGLRALDGLLTCGEGQRLGVYGEAGAGKSTLMSAIVKGSSADVAVVALVGERGREVREFVEHNLGAEGLKNAILIVATSDRPAAERVVCAQAATTVAEYFRDQGLKVLLFVDNVTRYARALREIGLAAGEPPTRRGFPPSVFAALPQLMERAGMGVRGSITAFYTVLVEDGMDDPIAEETRGILDGHVILSRALAATGHYPAIDVLTSRSRVMSLVTDPRHQAAATKIRSLWAKYQEIEFLLQVGEYKPGGDALADEAIAKIGALRGFLRQDNDERTSFAEILEWLNRLCA